ncbi:hypothetical protein AMC99_02288 [Altererythrobacter epoxidivorans]|uniref:Uncharacterized protein n=1 Tax=Altererythrobacter epoxidivorans TaxID=361183 RepID=A0A0M4MXD3_9SPHN|nr:hypothetical protein AMC99_02288 [Altererythrobacter epoxidivorans]
MPRFRSAPRNNRFQAPMFRMCSTRQGCPHLAISGRRR